MRVRDDVHDDDDDDAILPLYVYVGAVSDTSSPIALAAGQDPLVIDAIRSVQELYRTIKPHQPSHALTDLCKDILLLANKCGGYAIDDTNLQTEADILAATLEEEEQVGSKGADDQIGVSPILIKPLEGPDTRRRSRTSSFAMVRNLPGLPPCLLVYTYIHSKHPAHALLIHPYLGHYQKEK